MRKFAHKLVLSLILHLKFIDTKMFIFDCLNLTNNLSNKPLCLKNIAKH